MSMDMVPHGAGYLAKFGPTDESKVFWVDPVTGTRFVGDAQKTRDRWIAALMAMDELPGLAEVNAMTEMRRLTELRRLEYAPSVGATDAGGVVAEMELLDAPR